MTANPLIVKRILAQNLTRARKALKLTQEQVAERAGIPKSTYAAYEEGRREPSTHRLWVLARLFKTSTDALISTPVDIIVTKGDNREI